MKSQHNNQNLNKGVSIHKLHNIFMRRGISNIQVGSLKIQNIPLLSMVKNEKAKSNIKNVINDLGIDQNSKQLISKRTVDFDENVLLGPLSKNFPNREKSQKLFIYNYIQKKTAPKTFAPIVIFSHGGAIKKNTSLNSPFLSIIKQYGERLDKYLMLVTFDHRGSNSHKEKQKYSLEDRVADIELAVHVSLTTLLPEYEADGILWDGNIIFMGNSMGGHVATMAASEFHPNSLILPQPAAYAESAQKLPFGPKFTKAIREKDSWKTSVAFDALEDFLNNGGKALIIEADEDEKVPADVIKRYVKELTYSFTKHISQSKLKNSFFHVPGYHETIHAKEVMVLKSHF